MGPCLVSRLTDWFGVLLYTLKILLLLSVRALGSMAKTYADILISPAVSNDKFCQRYISPIHDCPYMMTFISM